MGRQRGPVLSCYARVGGPWTCAPLPRPTLPLPVDVWFPQKGVSYEGHPPDQCRDRSLLPADAAVERNLKVVLVFNLVQRLIEIELV